METKLKLKVEGTRQHQLQTTVIEEYSVFDDVMEKVTNGMFKVILFGCIPYFLWILFQFLSNF